MTPTAAGLQIQVENARADLAKRLSVNVAEISLVQAEAVTWPDSSLGCPQNGMAYTQILSPGFLVILEYSGNKYEYHAGRGGEVFYCPHPTSPVPGAPGDT